MPTVHLIDYVAGNIRSLVNAIEKVGYTVEWIKTPEDVVKAEVSSLILHFSPNPWGCPGSELCADPVQLSCNFIGGKRD